MKTNRKHLIAYVGLAVIAAILTSVTMLYLQDGGLVIFFLIITLGLPVLLPYIGLLIIFFKSLHKKTRFHKTAVILSILIASIMPTGCVVSGVRDDQHRQYHHLPDGTEMTVWQDYIIFEHYDKITHPSDNYLYVGPGQNHYSLCVTPDNELFLWVESLQEKVIARNPRYRLCGIYEGSAGEYWYNAECPATEQQFAFSHDFMVDGIHTGGSYKLIITNPDSVWYRIWSYSRNEYSKTRLVSDKHLSHQEQAKKDSIKLEKYLRYNNIMTETGIRSIDYRDSTQYRLNVKRKQLSE